MLGTALVSWPCRAMADGPGKVCAPVLGSHAQAVSGRGRAPHSAATKLLSVPHRPPLPRARSPPSSQSAACTRCLPTHLKPLLSPPWLPVPDLRSSFSSVPVYSWGKQSREGTQDHERAQGLTPPLWASVPVCLMCPVGPSCVSLWLPFLGLWMAGSTPSPQGWLLLLDLDTVEGQSHGCLPALVKRRCSVPRHPAGRMPPPWAHCLGNHILCSCFSALGGSSGSELEGLWRTHGEGFAQSLDNRS